MNDQERGTNNQDEVAQAKAEVQQEINEARAKQAAEIPEAERILAESLLNNLRTKAEEAREVRQVAELTGGVDIRTKSKEAASVKKTLVKVLEAVRLGIISPPSSRTKII